MAHTGPNDVGLHSIRGNLAEIQRHTMVFESEYTGREWTGQKWYWGWPLPLRTKSSLSYDCKYILPKCPNNYINTFLRKVSTNEIIAKVSGLTDPHACICCLLLISIFNSLLLILVTSTGQCIL